jgi:toxin YoeB
VAHRRVAVFDPSFVKDLKYWVEVDRRVAKRLLDLVAAALNDPFDGIGKR